MEWKGDQAVRYVIRTKRYLGVTRVAFGSPLYFCEEGWWPRVKGSGLNLPDPNYKVIKFETRDETQLDINGSYLEPDWDGKQRYEIVSIDDPGQAR